jgi:hypothetical protein
MNVAEIQAGALTLPEDQRASLVADLLATLPAVLSDIDDGSKEAKRRLEEMKSDPSSRRSWNQIKTSLGR